MNWKEKHYSKPKPGDKIKIIKKVDYASIFKKGDIYTLKNLYGHNNGYDWWSLIDADYGIRSDAFEVIK